MPINNYYYQNAFGSYTFTEPTTLDKNPSATGKTLYLLSTFKVTLAIISPTVFTLKNNSGILQLYFPQRKSARSFNALLFELL